MSKFYTNAFPYGEKICVRGYEDGQPFTRKEHFSPTLYLKSKDPNSKSPLRTLDGIVVEEVHPGGIRATRDFVKMYEGVSSFEIYGNTNYTCQYISDNYAGDIDWNMDAVKVFTIDIETQTEHGFPDIASANEEILLITIKDRATKRFITFGTKPYVHDNDALVYITCADEHTMLKEFCIWWQSNYPDIITGWNSEFFDIPYLVNRITRELGESFSKKLSPWGMVTARKTFIKGSEELHYDIAGISHLDYIQLYKKFTYSKQESYRLDYIAEQELGDRKKENPTDTFKDFYTHHWQQFVDYNIQDVELVDRLEQKMRLIELCMTMAYYARINYEDVFSQVRMWDAIIYNHLRQRDIVIPPQVYSSKEVQFEGAYVKDPLIGLHRMVASFDAQSLYPHLIMQYNISPETLTSTKLACDVTSLLSQTANLQYAHDENLAVTANGWCYRKDVKGFMPELMENMYKDRSMYKKKMLAVQQEYENDKTQVHLLNEISRLNNLQMAMKIALNSAYGAMGSKYFRYFDVRMAEGITTSGQLSIRWMAERLNAFLNKTMSTVGVDYIIAIDTDSIYLTLENLVDKVCAGKTTEQKIRFMDKICNDVFQPLIHNGYQDLADYMNAYSQKMIMKREVLADAAIWTAKKRYILNVHNSEGVQYAKPKLKVMGLEMVKSSTPSVIRGKLKDSLHTILAGDESKLHDYIEKFREEFNTLPVEDIAFPRGVNGMVTYAGSPIYAKGTPIHVRASLLFNHHIKRLSLDKKYEKIKDGDKIKFVYVRKPNVFHEDVIAFPNVLPKEFGLHDYIDYDLQFKKVFLDAMQTVIESLGWKTERASASLEDFFG